MGYKTTLCDVSLDGGHYGIAAPAVDFKPGFPLICASQISTMTEL